MTTARSVTGIPSAPDVNVPDFLSRRHGDDATINLSGAERRVHSCHSDCTPTVPTLGVIAPSGRVKEALDGT